MSGRTRILFVINTLANGGSERQLVELAKGLDRERFDPMVACLVAGGPLTDELNRARIPVAIFDFSALRRSSLSAYAAQGAREFIRFVQHIRRLQPEVVHGFLFASN